MKAYLRVKITSLAAEARIIHNMELKRLRWLRSKQWGGVDTEFWGLRNHRIFDVRSESRVACLAYGFLRGRSYKAMEAKCHTQPNWTRVQQLIEKYGEGDTRELVQKFAEWKDAG